MKAIQKELGEGDEQAKEIDELRAKLDAAGLPDAVRKEAMRELDRLSKMPVAAAEYTVSRMHLDHRAPLGEAHRGFDRSQAHERRARRRPFRPREGEGPRARVPGGSQAESRREGTDSLLRRPPWRRQDVARQVHCQFSRPQVRARVARRHARRGRDSRSPAHLHRRAAGPGHSGAAPRRIEEPVFILDEIDKLGSDSAATRRRRFSKCSIPNRTIRFAITTSTCRSTSRSPLSDDRERARSDAAGAARPHGGARARRLHRGREAQDCRRAPRRQTDCEPWVDRRAAGVQRCGNPRGHSRLYARGRRRNLEREIGALCRKVARRRAEGDESKVSITPEVVVEMLGAPTFLDEEIENRTKDPGVAVGLAWTPPAARSSLSRPHECRAVAASR